MWHNIIIFHSGNILPLKIARVVHWHCQHPWSQTIAWHGVIIRTLTSQRRTSSSGCMHGNEYKCTMYTIKQRTNKQSWLFRLNPHFIFCYNCIVILLGHTVDTLWHFGSPPADCPSPEPITECVDNLHTCVLHLDPITCTIISWTNICKCNIVSYYKVTVDLRY